MSVEEVVLDSWMLPVGRDMPLELTPEMVHRVERRMLFWQPQQLNLETSRERL